MFKKAVYIARIIPKLGFGNVLYMFWYLLTLKAGLRGKKFLPDKPVEGLFYTPCSHEPLYPENWKPALQERADDILKGNLIWFHYHTFFIGTPPAWFKNPFTGDILANPEKHWTELSDFNLNIGDIKIIWETSRMDWLTDLARAYKVFGDEKYLYAINNWLENWSQNNPLNIGPNWKCGQEASIRLMKLFTAAVILDQAYNINQPLQLLIYHHLKKIAQNIKYAIAQDNNHGTSETAALYIGSLWLLKQEDCPIDKKELRTWKRHGRKWLENRIMKLIGQDGTFSQKSTNYHRVVVDTMSWALHAMRVLNEKAFDTAIFKRLENLGQWQYRMMVNTATGEVPNIGPNDGALFENLHCCGYVDYKPSTQLFFGLLLNKRTFSLGPWDEPLFWRNRAVLSQQPEKPALSQLSAVLDKQFIIMEKGSIKLVVKVPNNKFRVSPDPFHIDVWYKGEPLFVDCGSYSYNAGDISEKFKSIASHNTIIFDNREPMPKISRFLYGEWLNADTVTDISEENGVLYWKGSYKDYRNCRHTREVWLSGNKLEILDSVTTLGNAVLNLHIPLTRKMLMSDNTSTFSFDGGMMEIEGAGHPIIHTAEHSRFYLQKEPHLLIKLPLQKDHIKTTVLFN